MRKEIAIAAVGAVFQVTLLILRPDWVKQHWPYLVGLWVLAAGLWLFAMFKREKTEELRAIQTGAVQNSGQMVSPIFSGIKGSNIHINTSVASAPVVANEPFPEPVPKAKRFFQATRFSRWYSEWADGRRTTLEIAA